MRVVVFDAYISNADKKKYRKVEEGRARKLRVVTSPRARVVRQVAMCGGDANSHHCP